MKPSAGFLLGLLAMGALLNTRPYSEWDSPLPIVSSVSRILTPERPHRYRLHVKAGTFISGYLLQQGEDLTLHCKPPGRESFVVDSPNNAFGPEPFWWEIHEDGELIIKITTFSQLKVSAPYTLTITAVGPRHEQPAPALEAARSFNTAERLRFGKKREEALVIYDRAASQWTVAGNSWAAGIAEERRAYLFRELNNPDPSIRSHDFAGELFLAAGDTHRHLDTQIEKSRLLHREKRYTQARDALIQLLIQARASSYLLAEARILNLLALISQADGNYSESLLFYHQSVSAWRKVNMPQRLADVLRNLGFLWALTGDLKEACAYYQEALDIQTRTGDHIGRSRTLYNFGWAAYREGQYLEAEDLLKESIRLALAEGSALTAAYALDRLGTNYRQIGRFKESEQCYQQVLRITRQAKQTDSYAITLGNLAELYLRQNRLTEAAETAARALTLLPESTHLESRPGILRTLADVHRREGNLTAAKTYLEEAVRQIEGLREKSPLSIVGFTFFQTGHEFVEDHLDLLADLHDQDTAAGYDDEAFECYERLRSKGLFEALASKASDQKDLQGESDGLLGQIQTLALTTFTSTRGLDASTNQLYRDADLRNQTIERMMLRVDGPKPPKRPAFDVEAIREGLLDEHTALLSFVLGQKSGFLWFVTKSDLKMIRLPDTQRLQAESKAYQALLADNPTADDVRLQESGTQLFDLLLGQVADELGSFKTLLIIADGALHYLPFATLYTQTKDAGNQRLPLAASHQIVHLPSASFPIWMRERERPLTRADKIAVFANPVYTKSQLDMLSMSDSQPTQQERSDESFKPIPFTEREANVIKGLVTSDKLFLAKGFAASLDTLRGMDLTQYRLLHFATHGFFSTERPELSGLVLSLLHPDGRERPGYLLPHEIASLKLNADLVVLSACRTAWGKTVKGEGVLGMARAFMEAGASGLVVSLWPVDDQATADFMEYFYSGIFKRGLTPAGALQRAQNLMRESPEWSSPFYWGGFIYQGEWRVPLKF